MGKILYQVTPTKLAKSIVGRLLYKFDSIIVIEGGTGQSKSTLAIHIARAISKEFHRLFSLQQDTVQYYYDNIMQKQGITLEKFIIMLLDWKEKKYYKYNPYTDLIYDHKTMLKGLSSWHRIMIPDEAILLSHNRDFQGPEQKKIIKMVNVYRDHGNVVIMCIPNFNALDVQLKTMIRIRISVARRGIGIVQTPNKTFYGKDKWESSLNEKIEKEYLAKNPNKPAFSRLTTARATITYPKLSERLEAQYQQIKNEKRGTFEEDIGAKEVIEGKDTAPSNKPLTQKEQLLRLVDLLEKNLVKNRGSLNGYAIATGLPENKMVKWLTKNFRKQNKPSQLEYYFWDKKERKAMIEPLVT